MTIAYIPQAGTIAARALAHFVDEVQQGAELANNVLGERLGGDPNILGACLQSPVRHGLLIRTKREGRIYWRRGIAAPPRPPEDSADQDGDSDDVPDSIARTVPATAAAPLAGLTQQSWCPAALHAERESSLDELPAPAARAAVIPVLGLGWKASGSARPTDVSDAPTVNAETALALSSALALTPLDDPDFREVERAPAPPEPDTPPKGAEAARAPVAPCGRDDATPNNGVVPQDQEETFRCALWSNGRLHIELYPGNFMLLTKVETQHLLRYVGDVLSARARAGA